MPFQKLRGAEKLAAVLLYHFGRILVYGLLGVIIFSFKSFFNPQIQQALSITMGLVLFTAGILTLLPSSRIAINLPWKTFLIKQLGKFVASPGYLPLFMVGVLNGMLPCGLVYMALSGAVLASSSIDALMIMVGFGLGTMPVLVVITLLKQKISFLNRTQIRKFVPFVMIVFGCLFVIRGLNLGIPYLSPKAVIEHSELTFSSCHLPQ
jgi:sulfite exporter TauE/SafE